MTGFQTILGHGLVAELDHIVPRPYAVVTMPDLWPRFEHEFGDGPALVLDAGLDHAHLQACADKLDGVHAIVGLGGGQAIDAAKYLSWQRRLALFQVPTALSVNAAWAQRSAVRNNDIVSYRGWAVPEAVFVDYDVIREAPPLLNWSGAADVLCYHTALWDWKWASDRGKVERNWPYDAALAESSRQAADRIVRHADDIHALTDEGIRALVDSLSYGGGAFADAGWNPRHIEGSDHFIFYALEYVTKKSFLHGQAVGLGILIAAALQRNEPDRIRAVLDRIGIPYTPTSMNVSWADVRAAIDVLPTVIEKTGLWYTIASERRPNPAFVDALEAWIETPSQNWVDPDGG